MATNKKPTQKPILDTDVESNELTETNVTDVPTETTNSVPFVKSRRRTSLSEFATVNNLRPEVQAGFSAWLKGDIFHFDEDWTELYEKYENR